MIQLRFSAAINGANRLSAYRLQAGTTRRGVTTFKGKVPLTTATYNPATFTVTLVPSGKLNLAQLEKLTVSAGLLTDSFGRPFAGGTNYVATFSKYTLTVTQAASVREFPVTDT